MLKKLSFYTAFITLIAGYFLLFPLSAQALDEVQRDLDCGICCYKTPGYYGMSTHERYNKAKHHFEKAFARGESPVAGRAAYWSAIVRKKFRYYSESEKDQEIEGWLIKSREKGYSPTAEEKNEQEDFCVIF